MAYTFTHSVECHVEREFAWRFWADVRNWEAVDPAVDAVSLEGPFAAGTWGETRTSGGETVGWRLAEVFEGDGAVVEMSLSGALLKFAWTFEETGEGGTRITQLVTLEGERAGDYAEGMKMLEHGIPEGMRKLCEAMLKASGEAAGSV
jgi:hypothetical protein